MIVPSIDLENGNAVQLVGGEELAIDAGSPEAVMERFRLVGEVAVIDLDAARGIGSNAEVVARLCRMGPVRVGGGIRDLAAARRWLDLGARSIIIGTAATPQLLSELPAERVQVALDARDGEVVVEGWRKGTGRGILERIEELHGLCGGFLVTFVEREGRLGGTDLERARQIVAAAAPARVTIAGGVTTAAEIAALDRMGADAQVGMALYSGRLDLADAFAAPLASDREDGLFPTVVTDDQGVALGLVYSSAESLRVAIDEQRGVYQSRSRGLWRKGETSGDVQELLRVQTDCDRDALRFTVRQLSGSTAVGGFCHLGTRTCFGEDAGLGRLSRRLADRLTNAPMGSYTARLAGDPKLLAAKLREEVDELIAARGEDEVRHEAADVLYFALVRALTQGVDLAAIAAELDGREWTVTRRPGDAKEDAR